MKIASYPGNGENKGGDAANIDFYFGWQQLWEQRMKHESK
jgi:hypothetical protein